MPERSDPISLNRGEAAAIKKAVKRVNSLPRGRWRGPSTYRPQTGTKHIGKLLTNLSYGGTATFKIYYVPEPLDLESEPKATIHSAVTVHNWDLLQEGEYVDAVYRGMIEYIGGRWYLTSYERCPIQEEEV